MWKVTWGKEGLYPLLTHLQECYPRRAVQYKWLQGSSLPLPASTSGVTESPINSKGSLQDPAAFLRAQQPWLKWATTFPQRRASRFTPHFPKHFLLHSIQITDELMFWRLLAHISLCFSAATRGSKTSPAGQAVPEWPARGGMVTKAMEAAITFASYGATAVPGTFCRTTVRQHTDKCPRTKHILLKTHKLKMQISLAYQQWYNYCFRRRASKTTGNFPVSSLFSFNKSQLRN